MHNYMWYKEVQRMIMHIYIYPFLTQYNSTPTIINHCNRYMNLQDRLRMDVICREGYTSAEGVLSHLNVVGELLAEAQKYADIVELSVQGPAEELEKLKDPLASMNAVHYPIFPGGIRNTKQW